MLDSTLARGLNSSICWVGEDNWSIVSDTTDIWNGELPYKTGVKFPTENIIDRATISKTNRLVYDNNVEEIYSNIISIFPEIDPTSGWQIREIVTNLPYFKNSTNAWVGLVAGDTPLVDIDDDELDISLSEILENSNFAEVIQNEVRSRFMDVISAYRVEIGLDGKPSIVAIESKNLVCFVNKYSPSSIEVNVVFSIYTNEDGESLIDFVEYHYDGKIVKTTFMYENGIIGDLVEGPIEDVAFDGKFKCSPIVVFKHNTVNNEVYGTDQYRYWYPSMIAGMRELQNILRLGERTREMIRKVPESAIKKNASDGSSVFFNMGTVGYTPNGENSPDIEYVVPEIRMEEAVKALNSAIKQIGIDTQLGTAFFNLDTLGSRLSAESIKAALFPAKLEAKRITTEMKPSVKELVIKIGHLIGLDLKSSKLSIEFYDGFPKDELNDIKAIQMRLESSSPSISLEGAIMKLDRVPLRVAKRKASKILGSLESLENDQVKVEAIGKYSSDVKPTAGHGEKEESVGVYSDNTLWDNQFATKPRDIPQGVVKGVKRRWIWKKINKS